MPTPRVEIQFGARTEEFGKGVRDVSAHLNQLGNLVQNSALGKLGEILSSPLGAAAGAVGAILAGLRESVRHTERIQELSAKIGSTSGQAQGVIRAEARAGLPAGAVAQSIDKLQEQIGGALSGNKAAIGALGTFGIAPDAVTGMTPLQVFERVLERFKTGASGAREYAAANQLLGRSFDDLIPAVRRGLLEEMRTPRASDLTKQDVAAGTEAAALGRSATTFWPQKVGIGLLRYWKWLVRQGRMGLNVAGMAIGGALPGGGGQSIIGEGLERLSDLQAEDLSEFGRYDAGDSSLLELRLRGAQQRRALLDSMRAANRTSVAGLQFSALSTSEQLASLQTMARQAAGSLGTGSPFSQERVASGLIKLQEDITKLQQSLEKELRELNSTAREGVRGVTLQ